MENTIKVPGRLESSVRETHIGDHALAGARDIFDDTRQTYQNEINTSVLNSLNTISEKVDSLGSMSYKEHTSQNVTINPDSFNLWRAQLNSWNITLVPPTDPTTGSITPDKVRVYTCVINAGATPVITFAVQGEGVILKPSGFAIEPSCVNEVQIMYAGGTFYVRSLNYK